VYAASEFGSTGSMRDGRAGLSTTVLEESDDADVGFRIVDGELWIRSRTGMLGYYGDPPVDPDAWRPTGDLVEVDGDRIHFLGRSSEIINVGGVKVHPLTIEERVSAVDGVSVARIFGRPNPMTGQIVALEVVPTPGADQTAVEDAIREACADLPPAARPRSIRFVDQVAMAGSKIVRRTPGEQ
jgi:acyl-CoA synthetase (AMP-forming)/AMP-acid ligase II